MNSVFVEKYKELFPSSVLRAVNFPRRIVKQLLVLHHPEEFSLLVCMCLNASQDASSDNENGNIEVENGLTSIPRLPRKMWPAEPQNS